MTWQVPTKQPIKIVHVLHSFDSGGLENGVLNLINGLNWNRYQHVLCCITRSGRMAERLKRDDVEVIELNKKPGPDWFLPVRLARVFRKIKPHIVHTRNWGAIDGIVGARLSGSVYVVHSEHGVTMSEIDKSSRKRNTARRLLSTLVDRFITLSEDLQEWARRDLGIPSSKLQTICNGVDVAKFNADLSILDARHQCGFAGSEFIVGSVGRLDPIKNHAGLIRAYSQLAQSFPHARLLIVGSGPCGEELQHLVKALGLSDRVTLMGTRDDIPRLLRCMDVFALPSFSEGISNTVLEAMAAGLPVIATDVGGNGELVRNKETGMLIPNRNDQALKDAILLYLKNRDLILQHGNSGRDRVEKQYSLSKMLADYDELYTSLVRLPN